MKRIIGIVPAPSINKPDTGAMSDFYKLGYNYVKRTEEAGCIPIGLAPVDYWIDEEALDICDAFLVQGGMDFYPYHYQVVHHAFATGKRYLGVCLGSQLIYAYFELKRRVEERGYEGDIVKAICKYVDENGPDLNLLDKVTGHRMDLPARGNEDAAKHDVDVVPGTLLHKLLGSDKMRLCSFHHYCVPSTQRLVTVNARSSLGDGVVEGVEYGDNILGIQGHFEVDELLPEIFAYLSE